MQPFNNVLLFAEGGQINNMMQTHQYPALNQLSHVYEQQQLAKELNKYASLKAVGKDVHSKGSLLACQCYTLMWIFPVQNS